MHKKQTKVYSKIVLVKSSGNNFIFFTCILPDFVAHESFKVFWKNGQNSLWQTDDALAVFTPIKILTH